MLKTLDFVLVFVPDIEAAKTFYTEKLGLRIDDQSPDFVQFARPNGGAVFAAQQQADAAAYSGAQLWWAASDIDATYAALTDKGVTSIMPPTDMPFGRIFILQDPFGHKLHFFSSPNQG